MLKILNFKRRIRVRFWKLEKKVNGRFFFLIIETNQKCDKPVEFSRPLYFTLFFKKIILSRFNTVFKSFWSQVQRNWIMLLFLTFDEEFESGIDSRFCSIFQPNISRIALFSSCFAYFDQEFSYFVSFTLQKNWILC